MAGNGTTTAARIWNLADAYVADVGTPAPTDLDTDLTAAYDLVGLIDDDAGIGREFTSTDTDHYAYGSILIRTTSVKEKLQLSMTALENSDLVWLLANPGSETSAEGGGITKRIRRPRNLGLAIKTAVLELDDGDVRSRLWIPRAQIIQAGTASISDNDIAGTPLLINVLADTIEGSIGSYIELTNDPDAAPTGS